MTKLNRLFFAFFLMVFFTSCVKEVNTLDAGFQTIMSGDPWFFKISKITHNGWCILENRGMEAYFRKYDIKTQQLIYFDETADKVWEIEDINSFMTLKAGETCLILSEAFEMDNKFMFFVGDRSASKATISNVRSIFFEKNTGKLLPASEVKYNLPVDSVVFKYDDFTEKPFKQLNDGRFVTAFFNKLNNQKYIAFINKEATKLESFPTDFLWSAQTTFEQNNQLFSFWRVVEKDKFDDFLQWNEGSKSISARKHDFSELIPLDPNTFLVAVNGTPAYSRRALEYYLASPSTLALGNLVHKHADVIALNYRNVGEGTANINYKFLSYKGYTFVVFTNFNNDLNVLRYDPTTKTMQAVYALSSSSPYELLDVYVEQDTGDFYVLANTVVNKTKACLAFFKIRDESLL